jgi:hypothetical protein
MNVHAPLAPAFWTGRRASMQGQVEKTADEGRKPTLGLPAQGAAIGAKISAIALIEAIDTAAPQVAARSRSCTEVRFYFWNN